MTDMAKVPSHHDMDWGDFRRHWMKRHAAAVPTWDSIAEKYEDDDSNIWWAIRNEHERIHTGRGRRPEEPPPAPMPEDHLHLPRIDPDVQRRIQRELQELL